MQEICTSALQFKGLWYSWRYPEVHVVCSIQYAVCSMRLPHLRLPPSGAISPRNILYTSPIFPMRHACRLHIIFLDLDHSSIQRKPFAEMSWRVASPAPNMKFQPAIISNDQPTISTNLQCEQLHNVPSVKWPHHYTHIFRRILQLFWKGATSGQPPYDTVQPVLTQPSRSTAQPSPTSDPKASHTHRQRLKPPQQHSPLSSRITGRKSSAATTPQQPHDHNRPQ
jgi:hypothetical protein